MSNINLDKLVFNKKDIVGEGTYSRVYKFNYNNRINNSYVVKKIKYNFLYNYYKKNLPEINDPDKEIIKDFDNETKALRYLGKKDITPKIYHIYKNRDTRTLFYVLESLDYTLGDLLRKDTFTREHFDKFFKLIKKVLKTRYRHNDMHIDNVMFSKKRDEFLLIDFGIQKKLNKYDKEQNLYYSEYENQKNFSLFDRRKNFKNSILGTSEASAIFIIYQYIKQKKWKDKQAYFIKFIKKYSLSHMFDDIMDILDNPTIVSNINSRKSKKKSSTKNNKKKHSSKNT